jgi:CBS domain-containing protein
MEDIDAEGSTGPQNDHEPSKRPSEKFAEIAAELRAGKQPERITARTLLDWFGAKRRGPVIVSLIDSQLSTAGITTDPDYKSVWVDTELVFTLVEPAGSTHSSADQISSAESFPGPIYRLERLQAANIRPISVRPQQTVKEALTVMMENNFSQLPVMSGERSLDGVISFSSLAQRLALGVACETVKDCSEPAHVVANDVSLFDAIDDIVKHQYVLVQGSDKRITGIVTTSDVSLEFRQLGEPFLLLGEIEQNIRALIDRGRFTPEDLRLCTEPRDTERTVSQVSDLSFGEYVRLIENEARWARLKVNLDRVEFKKTLEKVKEIRNEVMHFDPDPLEEEALNLLRSFASFLQNLRQILYRRNLVPN